MPLLYSSKRATSVDISGRGLRVDATAAVTGIMGDTFHGASVCGMTDILNTLRWGMVRMPLGSAFHSLVAATENLA